MDDAVERVARVILDRQLVALERSIVCSRAMSLDLPAEIRNAARALLAEITPMIVAEAVAKERERCAKVALTFTGWVGTPYHSNMDFGPNIPPKIAAAIRNPAAGEGEG